MPPKLPSRIPLLQPQAGVLTGGQPAAGDWEVLARDQGVATVVNLRADEELGSRDEAAEVAAAGMAYHHIPVAGPGDINAANATRLWRLLDAIEGPVLVHCGSGNRVGALLAIGAAREGGLALEEALALGRAGGLAGAEARVREVLAAPSAE